MNSKKIIILTKNVFALVLSYLETADRNDDWYN